MNTAAPDPFVVTGPARGRQRRRWGHFVEDVAIARRMVGYGAHDEDLTKATADVLLPHLDAIADEFYRQLLSHAESAAYFTLPDGRPDREHLAKRVDTLKLWLQRIIEAPLDEETVHYAASVAQAHARGSERGTRGVKGRYMAAMMCYLLAAFSTVFDETIEDRRELVGTIVAWSKLLTIHLDLLLAVQSTASSTARWY